MNEEKITIAYTHFENLNRNVLRLGHEVRDLCEERDRLKAEILRLERQVNYWKIEAEVDNARWMRTLDDLETLRKTMT
jgi:predicted RNase H-like nuclease (RuvC/YqgF family)